MAVKTPSFKWFERRLYERKNYVPISNDLTSDFKDDESSNTYRNSAQEISKPDSHVSENMDDAESANLTNVGKNKFSDWNDLSRNTGENTICHTSLT